MIFTVKGQDVQIDDSDWPLVAPYSWTLGAGKVGNGQRYIYTNSHDKPVYLHRLIMNAPSGLLVDHINRDTYDNRKVNLRLVNHLLSVLNRGLGRNNTSGVKGVSWHKVRSKWRAHIMVDHSQIHLGLFTNIEDAIEARAKAEQHYWAEYLEAA